MALSIASKLLISVIYVPVILILAFDDQEFMGDGVSGLVVEHTLDTGANAVFTRRGTINVSSFKSGSANYHKEGKLSPEDFQKLKDLAENDGVYRIRVGSKPAGSDKMVYVHAFTKASNMLEANMNDLLTINVDLSGNIIGVSLFPRRTVGVPISEEAARTQVEIVQTVPGPAPETQSFIQKMEQERVEKQKGQQQDNRSFFAKYWMYLVPLFIFLMFASNNPEAQGGGR